MTTPFICVFLAFLITFLSKIPFAPTMAKEPGGYDNKHPREQEARLTGWARRAWAGHQNAFEAFAPFAAAVIIAHLAQADPLWSARLAVTFVMARLLYHVFYIANWDKLRTTVWLVA